ANILHLQKQSLDVKQNMSPELATHMRNLWSLILADDIRISDDFERRNRRSQHQWFAEHGDSKKLRDETLVESRSVEYKTLARFTAMEASNVQIQFKPLMYANRLTEKLFCSWSRWVFDGHLLLANNTLNALPGIADGNRSTAKA